MSTTASAEREAILQTVRDFAQAEIRPHVMEWDEAQQFPHEVFRKLGELGLLGTIFPEEYGGAGLSTNGISPISRAPTIAPTMTSITRSPPTY